MTVPLSYNVDCKIVPHGSERYVEAVELRDRVLREPLGLRFTDEEFAAENEDIHVVALAEGRVVGTLLLTRSGDAELRMRQVAVASNARGSGVGTRMVEFAEQIAVERGADQMTLHAREGAIAFYRKLQYTAIGEPFTEVTLKHLKMQKFLKPLVAGALPR